MRPHKAIYLFAIIFGTMSVSFAVFEVFYLNHPVIHTIVGFDSKLYHLLLHVVLSLFLSLLLTKILWWAGDILKWKLQPKIRIGEVLINEDLLTRDQLNEALKEQNTKIGEILVYAGRLTQNQLGAALKDQRSASNRIGKILQERGYITEKDIQWALTPKARKFGEILIDKEFLTPFEMEYALAFQTGQEIR